MRRLYQAVLAVRNFFRSRNFAICVLYTAMAAFVLYLSDSTNAIYIRDGENISLEFTLMDEPEDILSEYGIMTMAYDSVDFTGFSGRVGEISITRAYPILVTADGTTNKYMITGETTVGQILADKGLSLGEHDIINFEKNHTLQENEHVVIQRVDYVERTEEEDIPYETVYKPTSLLRKGRSKTLTAGIAGQKEYVYVQRTVDGVVYEEELEEVNILKKPTTREILTGAEVPISPLDFGYELLNGAPTQYKQVITNAVATGYSARKGAKTASGRDAIVGHVAVNPNVIPYGSKLYITSADNKFIYGYAIAADTGTGLLAGIVDIDLFYDTYYESCLNGRRIVNIYILE